MAIRSALDRSSKASACNILRILPALLPNLEIRLQNANFVCKHLRPTCVKTLWVGVGALGLTFFRHLTHQPHARVGFLNLLSNPSVSLHNFIWHAFKEAQRYSSAVSVRRVRYDVIFYYESESACNDCVYDLKIKKTILLIYIK